MFQLKTNLILLKKFKELKIENIKKNKFIWEDFLIYLNAKIFTKSNYYFIRYLETVENKKGNKSKQQSKEQKNIKNKNEKKFSLDDSNDHFSSEEKKITIIMITIPKMWRFPNLLINLD